MWYNALGRTDIRVSCICLGTMTWGEQNTEAEAHRQLDMALEAGVNFLDTAEMYPIPPKAGTQGRTEAYIGTWLKARGNRDKVVIATKVSGPAEFATHIRGGPRFTRDQVEAAVDASLDRLGTDVIDLYQVHWPDRRTNFFGQLGYAHDEEENFVPLEDLLGHLNRLVEAGKVRAVGVSNESAWGLMSYLEIAGQTGLPRMVSIQNPYSLLNRAFEVGLAEVAIREECGLLAYSPLAFGTLSGKYLGGAKPVGARLTLFPHYERYLGPRAVAATEAYVDIAREAGLDPAQMALAYVNSRRFLTSTIIGATTESQLETDLASTSVTLPEDVVTAIEAVHAENPNPAP